MFHAISQTSTLITVWKIKCYTS